MINNMALSGLGENVMLTKQNDKSSSTSIPKIWEGMCYIFAGMGRSGKENGRFWHPQKVFFKLL